MSAPLPYLGLGLSSNLDARARPRPYELLRREPGLFDFLEYSAPLDVAEARSTASLFEEMFASRGKVPALFHPVHLNLYGPTLESKETLAALDAHAREVGSPWVGNDVGWWHEGGAAFPGYQYLSPPLDARGLEDCVAHALHVQAHVSVPLLLENPVVIVRRGEWHVLDFMAKLHARTGCGLILDLGHLLSHQLAYGLALETGFDGFPFEAVNEIHLAGGVVHGRAYFDDHPQPVREELFGLLEKVVPRCANLKALTYEGDGHPEEIARRTLRRLRALIASPPVGSSSTPPGLSAAEGLGPSPEPSTSLTVNGSDPWRLFDEARGKAIFADDMDGWANDVDIRLAVVAEELDGSFPFSRLLLAPDRNGLLEFTQSDEFLERFKGSGWSLTAAFSRWARTRVLAAKDEAASTALSFESWAHRAAHTHARPAPERGQVVLAPGWSFGVFPFDLSESLWAMRTLKRHLLSRAWAVGQVPAAIEGALAQTLRRPLAQPWNLALRLSGSVLSIRPLSTDEAALLGSAQRPIPSPGTDLAHALLQEGLLIAG